MNFESYIEPVAELCRKYHVHRLYLYGSILTSKFNPKSDIDFYVEFHVYNARSISFLCCDLRKLFDRVIDLKTIWPQFTRCKDRLLIFEDEHIEEAPPNNRASFVKTNTMKITILSFMDFCGSGNKLYHALNPYYDIEIWVGRHNNKYGHPVKNIYTNNKYKTLQQRINRSDVVILKGDFPARMYEQAWKIKFVCPTITMPTGTFFRKKEHGGVEQFRASHYSGHKVSSDTGLLYPEFSDTWTPMPIDSKKEPNLWSQGNVLTHSPTDKIKKNSEFIFRVFDGIMKRRNVEIDLIENVSFREAVERRKKSTIFFDQFRVGFYGNSALEAMQWGIPVACYLRPSKYLSKCPVLNYPLSVDVWVDNICKLLDSDMSELSRETKEWCDEHHSFEAVAERWKEVLSEVVVGTI